MKKIIISILFFIVYIIFSYNISRAADELPKFEDLVNDLGTDVVDILNKSNELVVKINGSTGAAQGYDKEYTVSKDTIVKDGSRVYCISAGEGLWPTPGSKYKLNQCVLIGPKGVYLADMRATGASYDPGALEFFSWNNDIWDNIPREKQAYQKLHYILSADDKYGTCSKGDFPISANNTIENHSQRQYAIWKNINPVLRSLADLRNWESGKGNYNDRVEYFDDETTKLYDEAEKKYKEIEKSSDYVAIWFFAYGGNNDGNVKEFDQDIIIGGKITKVPPPPVTEYGSIKVIKKDSNCGHELSGAKVQVYDNTTGTYVQNGKEWLVTAIIKNLIKGHSYTIYETGLPDNHTCSSNEITYKYTTTTNKTVTLNTTGTMTVTLENNRTATNGKITFRKVDRNTGEAINGIAFDLHKEDNSYVGTAWSTTLNGEKGWVTFNNVSFGNYYVRETNNKSREQGYTVNPTNGTLGYTKNIGSKWTGIKVTAANPDVKFTDSFKNTEYGGLTIEKKDETTKELIKGAKITFKLYKKNRK